MKTSCLSIVTENGVAFSIQWHASKRNGTHSTPATAINKEMWEIYFAYCTVEWFITKLF